MRLRHLHGVTATRRYSSSPASLDRLVILCQGNVSYTLCVMCIYVFFCACHPLEDHIHAIYLQTFFARTVQSCSCCSHFGKGFQQCLVHVQVHRGVYVAAEILYERFKPMVEEQLASSPFAKVAFTVILILPPPSHVISLKISILRKFKIT